MIASVEALNEFPGFPCDSHDERREGGRILPQNPAHDCGVSAVPSPHNCSTEDKCQHEEHAAEELCILEVVGECEECNSHQSGVRDVRCVPWCSLGTREREGSCCCENQEPHGGHYHCDVDELVERKISGKNPSDAQEICECVRSDEQEEITQEPENHQDAGAHISFYSVSALHFPFTVGSYLRATSSVGGFHS